MAKLRKVKCRTKDFNLFYDVTEGQFSYHCVSIDKGISKKNVGGKTRVCPPHL